MGEDVDPGAFNSWEDAFQYPIPTVRKLEQQLRSKANDNGEKLRGLVGSNYRALLGTAERIISMDEDMQSLEGILSDLGRNSNSRTVDRKFTNFDRYREHLQSQATQEYRFASQLAVLHSCPVAVSRLLEQEGSALLAAKILVISRLLHKNLSQKPDAPPYVEKLRGRLATLHRRVITKIDRSLAQPDAESSQLVDDMCALALTTSSAPRDVLRQFHKLRLHTLVTSLDNPSDVRRSISRALRTFLRTLKDTQAIFPRGLAESLLKLKACPLLQDESVSSVVGLNLEVHSRWISDEVRNFTPWPRHDELQKPEAEKKLANWAKEALACLLDGINSVLTSISDLGHVAQLRRETVQQWISSSNVSPTQCSRVLEDIRTVFRDRMETLTLSRTLDFRIIYSEMKSVFAHWEPNSPGSLTSLWDPSITTMSIDGSATAFRRAMQDRSHGRSELVLRVMQKYDSWEQDLIQVQLVIKSLRADQWEDELFDDIDDELGLEPKHTLLNRDDPNVLEKCLQDSLHNAVVGTARDIEDLISRLEVGGARDAAAQSILLLRVLREVSTRLRVVTSVKEANARASSSPSTLSRVFSDPTLVAPLHSHIAAAVISDPIAAFKGRLHHLLQSKRTPARSLWEGTPQLPTQPYAATFNLLVSISRAMASIGSDVWAPTAVGVLKAAAREQLGAILHQCTEGSGGEGSEESQSNPLIAREVTNSAVLSSVERPELAVDQVGNSEMLSQSRRDVFTQLVFDILYLLNALRSPLTTHDTVRGLKDVSEVLLTRAGVDRTTLARLEGNAIDYWKRTYMLFALLR